MRPRIAIALAAACPKADLCGNDILYDNTMAAPCSPPQRLRLRCRAVQGHAGARPALSPWWILKTGAVMSLVRFGDPMGPLAKASLPLDRQASQQAPDVMVGAAFVSEIFAVSQGKIASDQRVLDSIGRQCGHAVGGGDGGGEGLVAT